MRFLSAVFLLIQASLMTCSLFMLSFSENHEPWKKTTLLFSKGRSSSQNCQNAEIISHNPSLADMPFSCRTVKRRDSSDECLLFHSPFLHFFFSHVLINSLLSHHVFQMSAVILYLGVIFVANKWRLSMHCLVISWRNNARLQYFWPWFVLVWFREGEGEREKDTEK